MESLAAQLQELQSQVRRDASSAKLRVHLFQLLCVMGQWQRALAQLQVCAQLDAKALPMAQTYREAIRCELFRADVFAGKRAPQVMGKPPAWIGLLVEALRLDGTGDATAASGLRAQAMEVAEPTACSVDGVECAWLADGDARLGPTCEVIINGQYYWLPFESCAGMQIEAPADMRDLVWSPAEVLLPNEGRVPALVPTRYPAPAQPPGGDPDAFALGRATHWIDRGEDAWFGVGQRVWMTDVGEHPILDTRSIALHAAQSATAEAGA